ncbi:MAG: hypothetical protein HY834_08915 [Devosia nanyangense]|uniref:Uncharacterized protein n=1 Tax=Devosia nanyangense TaxID=1228055 RepID=A0A933L291_9HYPH|nr:hypothetical protein [Devosia nanyangense]
MGIRLNRPTEPVWVDLGRGAAVLAEAPSTPTVYAARAAAQALFVELVEAGEAVTRAGGRITGLPDLTDPMQAKGQQDALFVVCLAEIVVSDWKGILSAEGTEVEFDPALLVFLFEDHAAADRFMGNYLHPLNQVVAEGNA